MPQVKREEAVHLINTHVASRNQPNQPATRQPGASKEYAVTLRDRPPWNKPCPSAVPSPLPSDGRGEGWGEVRAHGKESRNRRRSYCLSYSPLLTRLRTVKPAFLASEMERERGVLKVEKTLRTGRRQAGQTFSSLASSGRRKVKRPWHTGQFPSHNSYSYIGMADLMIADAAANCAIIIATTDWWNLRRGRLIDLEPLRCGILT